MHYTLTKGEGTQGLLSFEALQESQRAEDALQAALDKEDKVTIINTFVCWRCKQELSSCKCEKI